MKNRKHMSYEGFPDKSISSHSAEYAKTYSGTDSDKVAVATEMSKHHGSGTQPQKKQGFMRRHPIATGAAVVGTGAAAYGAHKLGRLTMPTLYNPAGVARGTWKATKAIGRGLKATGKALVKKRSFGGL